MNGYELKLNHNSRGSWKEHIKFTEDPFEFMEKVHAIIKLHGEDTYASYKASYKENGGYGENKENGKTIQISWKGRLGIIYQLLDFPEGCRMGKIKRCTWCNSALEGEEIDAPHSYGGDIICDRCYNEKAFPCILCQEYMDDQNITHILVNTDYVGVPKGYYKVIRRPFFHGDCLGINMNVIKSAVQKVKDLIGDEPEGADYLCVECSEKIDKELESLEGYYERD
jgi:hypothetical protein